MRPLAVAVASGVITQVGSENFVGTATIAKVIGCWFSVNVGAQMIIFPKIIIFIQTLNTAISLSSTSSAPSFFNIVIPEVGDGKSMEYVKVAADFCPVAVVTEISDRQSVKSHAIVDTFHFVTVMESADARVNFVWDSFVGKFVIGPRMIVIMGNLFLLF